MIFSLRLLSSDLRMHPLSDIIFESTIGATETPTEYPSTYTYASTLNGHNLSNITSTTHDASESNLTEVIINNVEEEDNLSMSFGDIKHFSVIEWIIVGVVIVLLVLFILGIIICICRKCSRKDKFGKPQLSTFELESNTVQAQNNHLVGGHKFVVTNSVNIDL